MTDPDLPQLIFGGEYLRPERNSYRFTNPDGSRRTDVEGGPMLIQTDHLGGPFRVSVEYYCDSAAMASWFQIFWLSTTLEGSIPFQAALALNDSNVYEDYVCRLVGPPQWNRFTGFDGRVSCTLEVEQRLESFEYLDTIAALLAEYGDDTGVVFNELFILTNPTMDESIPA